MHVWNDGVFSPPVNNVFPSCEERSFSKRKEIERATSWQGIDDGVLILACVQVCLLYVANWSALWLCLCRQCLQWYKSSRIVMKPIKHTKIHFSLLPSFPSAFETSRCWLVAHYSTSYVPTHSHLYLSTVPTYSHTSLAVMMCCRNKLCCTMNA